MPPGPSQVDHHAGIGGHLAPEENIAIGHVILGGSRGQGHASVGMKFAVLENRSGWPENEVRVPCDVAILEILPAAVPVNGVVGAQELAVDENRLVPVDVNGQSGVMGGGGGILESEVVGVEPGRVDVGAGGTGRAESNPGRRIDGCCGVAVGQNHSRFALSDQGDIGFIGSQGQRLLVGPVLDIDDNAGRTVGGHRVEGGLDVGEIPGPVLGHDVIETGGGLGPSGPGGGEKA